MRISVTFLRDALGLPETVHVTGIREPQDCQVGGPLVCELWLEGDLLPEVEFDTIAPEVQAVFTGAVKPQCEFQRIEVVPPPER